MQDATTPAGDRSSLLRARIRKTIADAGGWIPFSRFMELALYAPGLGYYDAGARKFGRDPAGGSDFVTAPELTPLFARALARPVAEVLATSGGTILEIGGGTGRLAADLLRELEVRDRLPDQFLMLDVSADLRARQRATIETEVPHLLSRVRWPTALPAAIDGVVIGNEVLDAMPVALVVRASGRWRQRGVVATDDGFAFDDRPLPDALGDAVAPLASAELSDGYQTELAPLAGAFVASLVERMSADSVALFVDYGFPRSEYYHPQRVSGTLMTHRAHRSGVDVLADVGAQDLTSHVDFSALAEAAVAAGGTVLGYASQAAFLIDCGIADLVAGSPDDVRRWAPQAQALQILLSPSEMGELFKAIAFGRRARTLAGFRGPSRLGAL